MLQAAFRHLHGQRLHGFCLLLTLGDRAAAASAASEALASAMPRLGELRHPERAAAWLRARAAARLASRRRPLEPEPQRRESLRSLGVADPAFDGLAALDPRERAALIAADIERLELLDVEQVLALDAMRARRVVERARTRYLSVTTLALSRDGGLEVLPAAEGPPRQLATRIAAEAERTLGGSWGTR